MNAASDTGIRVELRDRIAVGGMAEIYEGRVVGAAGFSKRVAVKRLLPHLAENEEFVAMFLDEARIASQLAHPNVVQIFELGRVGEGYFIVMEFVDGVDLRALMRRDGEPMSVGAAAAIMAETLAGLGFAHERVGDDGEPLGIVHRDVSPANILLALDRAGAGVVKLTDFGVAKARQKSSRTVAGLLKGKLAYMSPEQARGLPVDARSDLFSASVILHELFVGRPLFEGATDFETLERLRTHEPERVQSIRREVPQALDELVAAGLSRDPGRRPGSAHEMRERLLPFASDVELAAVLAGERAKRGAGARPIGEASKAQPAGGARGTLVFAPTVVMRRAPLLSWRRVAATLGAVGVMALVALAIVPSGHPTSVPAKTEASRRRERETPQPVLARQEVVAPNGTRASDPARGVAMVAVRASAEARGEEARGVSARRETRGERVRARTVRASQASARRETTDARAVEQRTGTLTLQSKPYWGKIFLVGHKWPGKAETPAYRVPLPVGTYRVRLVYEPENLETTASVTIVEGKETVEVVSFPVHAEGAVR
jgi:serine/threonine-protein kinase